MQVKWRVGGGKSCSLRAESGEATVEVSLFSCGSVCVRAFSTL